MPQPLTQSTFNIGSELKQARRRKRLRVADVENQLKIRRQYIEAIEGNYFDRLPGLAYARQFVKAYAKLVGLPTNKLFSQSSLSLGQDEPLFIPLTLVTPKVFITPRVIATTLVGGLVLATFSYIFFQIGRFSRPPVLEIFSPQDDSRVSSAIIDVSGKTNPGVVVTINNEPVAQQVDGQFSQPIQLIEGINTFQVTAKNRFNKQTGRTINIIKPKDGEQALKN